MKVACGWCLENHPIGECPKRTAPAIETWDGDEAPTDLAAPLHEGLLNAARREGFIKALTAIAPRGLTEAEIALRNETHLNMALSFYPEVV